MGIFSPLHKGRPQSKRGMTKTGKPGPAGAEQPWPPERRAQTQNWDPRGYKRSHRPRVHRSQWGDPVGRVNHSDREELMACVGFVMDRDKYVYLQRSQIISQL